MAKTVHVVGNGDQAHLYNKQPRKGLKLTCNLPPFPVADAYATIIVDFKFMAAMTEGSVWAPGDWILGFRPKMWMDKHPAFHMKFAKQVKEFYTKKPKYVSNYTDFNCGHVAVYYACEKLGAERVHLYGFDSMFDFNLNSCSDFYLNSDRSGKQNNKLITNWRPIWSNMFTEFKDVEFIVHHVHDQFKFNVPDNVKVELYQQKKAVNQN